GEEKEWGDDVSGYFLVRDALRGYMRDDLWLLGEKLYRVAAAPVIDHQNSEKYVGAIVLGEEVDLRVTKQLEQRVSSQCSAGGADGSSSCDTHVGFFAQGRMIVISEQPAVSGDINKYVGEHRKDLERKDAKGRSIPMAPFSIDAAGNSYRVAIRHLP